MGRRVREKKNKVSRLFNEKTFLSRLRNHPKNKRFLRHSPEHDLPPPPLLPLHLRLSLPSPFQPPNQSRENDPQSVVQDSTGCFREDRAHLGEEGNSERRRREEEGGDDP